MNDANKDKGFIPIWRSVFDHWLWDNNEPFDKRSAWIDLLASACIEPRTTMHDGVLIKLGRGELKASLRYLQKRWNWGSISKVENFLKNLQSEDMVSLRKGQQITVITICNYDSYNAIKKVEKTPKGQQTVHKSDSERTDEGHAEDKVNNLIIKQVNSDLDVAPAENLPSTSPQKTNLTIAPAGYVLPDKYKAGYLATFKFAQAGINLKKLRDQLSPQEYEKLCTVYGHDAIMATLEAMENSTTWLKRKTSVYLTTLNGLKESHGAEDAVVYLPKFEEVYREFIKKQSKGEATAKIDATERRSLVKLIEYLKDKSKGNTYEAGLGNWKHVLESWGKLDNFMQARVKLKEIDNDIVKILTSIANANKRNDTGAGNTAKGGSQRRDYE